MPVKPLARPPSQAALVADAEGHTVDVEPLEHELGDPARQAGQVTEAGERDGARSSALADKDLLVVSVGRRREREPLSEDDEPLLTLEPAGERGIRDRERLETRRDLAVGARGLRTR